jgi:DNA-binding transcriptional regulator GbsR (MarR family)
MGLSVQLFRKVVNVKKSYGSVNGVATGMAEGSDTGRDAAAVSRFIERFALTLLDSGVPRMPARAFVAILASDTGYLTAAELARVLNVSPAAVSGAVRYLTQVGLIVRERDPGERRDHYRLHDDTWYDAMIRREELLVRWQNDLVAGIEAVGGDTPAGERLEETRRFFAFLHQEVPKMLDKWREVRAVSHTS